MNIIRLSEILWLLRHDLVRTQVRVFGGSLYLLLTVEIPKFPDRTQVRNTTDRGDDFGIGALSQMGGIRKAIKEEPQGFNLPIPETFNGEESMIDGPQIRV